MAFGYARASTFDQEEALQPDALTAPGRQRIFVDGASGKLESRPALDHTHLARVIVVDGHYARWVDAPDLLLVITFSGGGGFGASGNVAPKALGGDAVCDREAAPFKGDLLHVTLQGHEFC
jgi:hypothetical protein